MVATTPSACGCEVTAGCCKEVQASKPTEPVYRALIGRREVRKCERRGEQPFRDNLEIGYVAADLPTHTEIGLPPSLNCVWAHSDTL